MYNNVTAKEQHHEVYAHSSCRTTIGSRKHFKNLSLNKKKNKVSESFNFKIEWAKGDITYWAESGDRRHNPILKNNEHASFKNAGILFFSWRSGTDDIQETINLSNFHWTGSSEVGFLRCCPCTAELDAPHTEEKQRTTLYIYLFLGGYGIHLEAEFRILFFTLWQASSTDGILMWHNFSATKTRGFLAGRREQREAPPRQAMISGHSSQVDTEQHLLLQHFPLGRLAEPPPQLHHSWGTPDLRMKHHQLPWYQAATTAARELHDTGSAWAQTAHPSQRVHRSSLAKEIKIHCKYFSEWAVKLFGPSFCVGQHFNIRSQSTYQHSNHYFLSLFFFSHLAYIVLLM